MAAHDAIDEELADLRRRAYAPDADITDDPAAVARLIELEERVRAERLPVTPHASPAASPPHSSTAVGGGTATVIVEHGPTGGSVPSKESTMRRPRSRRHLAAVLAVGVAAGAMAIAAGATTASPDPSPTPTSFAAISPFAEGTETRTLVELAIDGAPAAYFDEGGQADPPGFPVPEGLAWATSFGLYYGWEVWLARTQSGTPCIAVVRGTDVISRCSVVDPFGPDGVSVLVPYAATPADERPDGMEPGQSVAYWWPAGGTIRIEVGTPALAQE